MSENKVLRVGIVGAGVIGKTHVKQMAEVPGMKLTAVSDVVPAAAEALAGPAGARVFIDYNEMIRSGEVDVVDICTPHTLHPPIAIAAFKRGLHVLCEKPIAVQVSAARRMIAAAERAPKPVKFGVCFQKRTRPLYQKAREIIQSGQLGHLVRATCVATEWYRTQTYYNSGGWRGTWDGEGGGVLMNQCPHTLDIYQWLVGMPTSVQAIAKLGLRHRVEIEDEVVAVLEYESGMTGTIIASTGEWPGVDRFEIAGDRGLMIIEGGKLTLKQTSCSISDHCLNHPTARMGGPEITTTEIADQNTGGRHRDILQNFVDAVNDNAPLAAPGVEGLPSLELANAIVMAGVKGKRVKLPLSGPSYDRFLGEMIANAKAGRAPAKA